jgi:hypothetical protein
MGAFGAAQLNIDSGSGLLGHDELLFSIIFSKADNIKAAHQLFNGWAEENFKTGSDNVTKNFCHRSTPKGIGN